MSRKRIYEGPVLVTGASRGIGSHVALMLAEQGYKVYCASRSGKAPGDGDNLIGLRLDVSDKGSILAARSVVKSLQVIVHCAGFGIAGSCEGVDVDDARKQLDTNFFGVLAVNSAFLPLLREHPHSLVVMTSSVAGLIPIPYQSHYSCSKFALEAYSEALRMECRPFGVRVVVVEPGDTRTSFTQNRLNVEPEDSPYYQTCLASVEKMAHDEMSGKSPATAASCIAGMLKRKNPPVRCAVGLGYKCLVTLKRLLPARLVQLILRMMYIPQAR